MKNSIWKKGLAFAAGLGAKLALGSVQLPPYVYHDDGRTITQFTGTPPNLTVRGQFRKEGPDSFCSRLSATQYLGTPACLAALNGALEEQRRVITSAEQKITEMQSKAQAAVSEGARTRIRVEIEKMVAAIQTEKNRLGEITARKEVLTELEVDLLPLDEVFAYSPEKDPEHARVIHVWATLFQVEFDKKIEAQNVARRESEARAAREQEFRQRQQQELQAAEAKRAAYNACVSSMRDKERTCRDSCKVTLDRAYEAAGASSKFRPYPTSADGTRLRNQYGDCLSGCYKTYSEQNCR